MHRRKRHEQVIEGSAQGERPVNEARPERWPIMVRYLLSLGKSAKIDFFVGFGLHAMFCQQSSGWTIFGYAAIDDADQALGA